MSFPRVTQPHFLRLIPIYILAAILPLVACTTNAYSIDVTGVWTGTSQVGSSVFQNDFALVQRGEVVIGSAVAGTASGVIVGTVIGNQLTFHSTYSSIAYSSDATATTDGLSMSGTFLDSQSTSGTFIAQKVRSPLTKTTVIVNPPVVNLHGQRVVLTFQKFTSVILQARQEALFALATIGLTFQYEVTVKSSAVRQRIVTTRNSVTLRKLSPGRYRASYRVSALKNGRRVYSTRPSPAASFVVGNAG